MPAHPWFVAFLSLLSASGAFGQNWWYDCTKTFQSPEGKYTLSCSSAVGDPSECTVGVLSIKGPGITDSIIVSQTSCHDCHPAQFFWANNAPLLIVETNKNKCEGKRFIQVFDLVKQQFLFTTDGQLWLFDEKMNVAIISTDVFEKAPSGAITGHTFYLYAYDVRKNRKTLIFSLNGAGPLWDEFDTPSVQFDPNILRNLKIQLPASQNALKISVRY